MIRSFRAVVLLAVVAPAVAVAQYPSYQYPVQSCPGGQCRPVAAVTGAVHNGVVNLGEVVRGVYADGSTCQQPTPRFIPRRMTETFVPGQPVRNLGRAVVQLFR